MDSEKMTDKKVEKASTEVIVCDINKKEEIKESAIVGLIRNELLMLEEELYTTELEYARAHRADPFSVKFINSERQCNYIEAKMEALTKLKMQVEEMFPPIAIA